MVFSQTKENLSLMKHNFSKSKIFENLQVILSLYLHLLHEQIDSGTQVFVLPLSLSLSLSLSHTNRKTERQTDRQKGRKTTKERKRDSLKIFFDFIFSFSFDILFLPYWCSGVREEERIE